APVWAYRYSSRGVKSRLSGWPAIPAVAKKTIAGHGSNNAIRPHPPNPVSIHVYNIEAPVWADRYSNRVVKSSLSGWSPISTETIIAAGHSSNDAIQPHPPNPAIAKI